MTDPSSADSPATSAALFSSLLFTEEEVCALVQIFDITAIVIRTVQAYRFDSFPSFGQKYLFMCMCTFIWMCLYIHDICIYTNLYSDYQQISLFLVIHLFWGNCSYLAIMMYLLFYCFLILAHFKFKIKVNIWAFGMQFLWPRWNI